MDGMSGNLDVLQKIHHKEIQKFQQKILRNYRINGRDLPWRKTTDPYKILVSEMMLQQTQVSRVIDYYVKWITKWPTIYYLASATTKEVLTVWMGLGYNRRGIYLHQAGKIIVQKFDGNVISAMRKHSEIPGIGTYTARAVRIFSINEDIVTVDTNIRRILIHEFHLPQTIHDKYLWKLAQRCLPVGMSCEWHNALMDYGAQQVTSRKTGIKPKTIQTSFRGSDREIRAKILRLLLNESLDYKTLQNKLDVGHIRLQSILIKLEEQRIITKEIDSYSIAE